MEESGLNKFFQELEDLNTNDSDSELNIAAANSAASAANSAASAASGQEKSSKKQKSQARTPHPRGAVEVIILLNIRITQKSWFYTVWIY